jgi:dihydroflavonol-4-reductase
MHTVFVTDGRGFFASWLIRYLLEAGYAVTANIPSPAETATVTDTLQAEGVPTDELSFARCRPDKPDGWKSAMRGADAVMLTPSPIPTPESDDKDAADVSERAARGVENMLKAAVAVGVPKAIMTSSQAANYPDKKCTDAPLAEDFWTDEHNRWLTEDMKAALKAEQKAWDIANGHPRLKLVAILPGTVLGPGMGGRPSGADQVFAAVLNGVPYPNATLSVCDVRDLAKLHVLAMEQDAADGMRLVAQSEEMTMPDVARILKAAYPERRISTGVIPNFAISGMARFQPTMQALNTLVGLQYHREAVRARTLLGWDPRPAKKTVLDTAAYLMANGGLDDQA